RSVRGVAGAWLELATALGRDLKGKLSPMLHQRDHQVDGGGDPLADEWIAAAYPSRGPALRPEVNRIPRVPCRHDRARSLDRSVSPECLRFSRRLRRPIRPSAASRLPRGNRREILARSRGRRDAPWPACAEGRALALLRMHVDATAMRRD